jgi:hypothetical protein
MRGSRLILSCAVVAVAAAAASFGASLAGAQPPGRLATQTSEASAVTVTVTPQDLAHDMVWEFQITLSTHSQPLGDDLMKSAALVYGSGARHAPLAWRGDGPGGHHRKGVLTFAAIAPRPAVVELQIQRAGETAPRSFKWQLP